MSWDEYEALGPSVRGEYIDGELVTSPFTFDPADLSACSEPGNGDSKGSVNSMFDDDDYHPLEADREFRHEIAHDYGTYPSGEPLPRHTDRHGRVWVTCNCGSKFLLKPRAGEDLSELEDEVADAIVEALDQDS